MIQPKENFVDRVEQSIVHLKNNLLPIALPITICNILFLILIPTIGAQLLPLEDITSWDISQKLPLLVSLSVTVILAYIITFAFILIPVQVAMLKSIKESLAGNKVGTTQYLWYGFKNIGNIFKTHWYIFLYVLIIPALLFIVWGLIFIIASMLSVSIGWQIMWIWWAIMILSIIIFMISIIYKGTKATFWLISAIDTEEFTNENLHASTQLSDKKWWRVFWNLFWISFIIWCVINLISFIVGLISLASFDWSSISELSETNEELNIQKTIAEFSQFNISGLITDIISTGIWSMLWTLITVFSYILFLRLRQESKSIVIEKKNNEIEL